VILTNIFVSRTICFVLQQHSASISTDTAASSAQPAPVGMAVVHELIWTWRSAVMLGMSKAAELLATKS
jgi:hypothetical protein